MNYNKSAFPVRNRWDSAIESFDLVYSGLTKKEYAAIRLKVPRSGDPEIDAMIRESVRRDFAEKALAGMLATELENFVWGVEGAIERAFKFADAMLAEWEKEAGK